MSIRANAIVRGPSSDDEGNASIFSSLRGWGERIAFPNVKPPPKCHAGASTHFNQGRRQFLGPDLESQETQAPPKDQRRRGRVPPTGRGSTAGARAKAREAPCARRRHGGDLSAAGAISRSPPSVATGTPRDFPPAWMTRLFVREAASEKNPAKGGVRRTAWWARKESNLRPPD
jgi:hypothetical protein